ncbi:MAG: hypothetical protein ACUVWV_14410 [Thermodesulfobacteriota bacterium]
MKRIFLIFFLFIISLASLGAQPVGVNPEVKPEEIVTLIISANVFGEYEPCG